MLNESMTNKRFILVFASIFLLGSMPLIIIQPTGASSAGLSMGFSLPIEHFWHMVVYLALGIYASFQRQSATALMPLAFLLLFLVGMALKLDAGNFSLMPMFALGAMLLFALSLSVIRDRSGLIGMIVMGSFGYHFGLYYSGLIPEIASPLYFLIGNLLCIALIFATAISFGLTLRSEQISVSLPGREPAR